MREIHQWLVDCPHKGPGMWKTFSNTVKCIRIWIRHFWHLELLCCIQYCVKLRLSYKEVVPSHYLWVKVKTYCPIYASLGLKALNTVKWFIFFHLSDTRLYAHIFITKQQTITDHHHHQNLKMMSFISQQVIIIKNDIPVIIKLGMDVKLGMKLVLNWKKCLQESQVHTHTYIEPMLI